MQRLMIFGWGRGGRREWMVIGHLRQNGEVLRKLSVGLATYPRRQSDGGAGRGGVHGPCESASTGAHYLYQFPSYRGDSGA